MFEVAWLLTCALLSFAAAVSQSQTNRDGAMLLTGMAVAFFCVALGTAGGKAISEMLDSTKRAAESAKKGGE